MTVSRWERDKNTPTPECLLKLIALARQVNRADAEQVFRAKLKHEYAARYELLIDDLLEEFRERFSLIQGTAIRLGDRKLSDPERGQLLDNIISMATDGLDSIYALREESS